MGGATRQLNVRNSTLHAPVGATDDMEHIEKLTRELERVLPSCRIRTEAGGDEPGSPTWVDVFAEGRSWVIEWRPRLGFGLTSVDEEEDEVMGVGADEVYPTAKAVVDRIVELIQTGQRTTLDLPRHALLSELRRRRRMSQAELARALGVSQANISQMERRGDLTISSLRTLIEALGGKLVVTAQFGDEGVQLSQFDADPELVR